MIKIPNAHYSRLEFLKPNVAGSALLVAIARDKLGRDLDEAEMRRASGMSYPGWNDNRDAVLAALDECFEIRPAQAA